MKDLTYNLKPLFTAVWDAVAPELDNPDLTNDEIAEAVLDADRPEDYLREYGKFSWESTDVEFFWNCLAIFRKQPFGQQVEEVEMCDFQW